MARCNRRQLQNKKFRYSKVAKKKSYDFSFKAKKIKASKNNPEINNNLEVLIELLSWFKSLIDWQPYNNIEI